MKIMDAIVRDLMIVRKWIIICRWIGTGLLCCSGIPSAAAKDAPDWLVRAAATTLPEYDNKVSHVVLHDELAIELNGSGGFKKTRNYALKIMKKEGRAGALAKEIYKTDTDRVREFRAWLLPPDSDVRKYDKDDIIDAALVNNDVYNEVRVKIISAVDEAVEGSVFGYKTVVEERSVFSQFEWFFHSYEPAVISRFSVELSEGWSLDALTFNHPEIPPDIRGNTYIWEMRDLPRIDYEPLSPAIENVAPRLVVSIYPPPEKASSMPSFRNWTDVSQWVTGLVEPMVAFNDSMAARANALVVDANSEMDKIEAIARFCQGINYISIQTGIGRGGGYQPHPATETFAKGYGDCKDKTSLMRAMLKAIGIDSWPVAVFSGDRLYVREEWPSPQQFNHSIIAVRVTEPFEAPAILNHEKLGRLLIFDPTDIHTRLGEIPGRIQGGSALLVAGKMGGLFNVPETSPQANRTERNVDVDLMVDGSIRASIREEFYGEAGSVSRAEYHERTSDAYGKMIKQWISDSVRRADISKIDFQPESESGQSTLQVNFTAERYGQSIPGGKILLNPNIVARRDSIVFTDPSRKLPVVVRSRAFGETVRMRMPSGIVVDEMPKTVDLKQPFGTYHAEYKLEDGELVYRRSLVMENKILPAEDYEAIRQFLISIRDSEQSLVVLRKI
jgi:transglutaminase-like putative cysteine protease